MKTKKILLLFALATVVWSCEDKDALEVASVETNDAIIADDETDLYISTLLDEISDEVDALDELVGDDGMLLSKSVNLSTQFTVSEDEGTNEKIWPKTIVVDWGEENVEGKNGVLHRGKVIITRYKPDMEKGKVRVVTFEDYYRNNNSIDGYKKQVSNFKPDSTKSISMNDSIHVITAKGKEFTRISRRYKTMIEGMDTREKLDDVYKISGGSIFINTTTKRLARVIVKPLIKKIGCRNYVEGTIQVWGTNTLLKVIDYGEGECDDEVTILKRDELTAYKLNAINELLNKFKVTS